MKPSNSTANLLKYYCTTVQLTVLMTCDMSRASVQVPAGPQTIVETPEEDKGWSENEQDMVGKWRLALLGSGFMHINGNILR